MPTPDTLTFLDGLIRGATGPTGPTGAAGTGPTGPTGPSGPTGSFGAGSAVGQAPVWNGSSFSLVGIASYALGNADETIGVNDGSRMVQNTTLTGNRTFTLETTGASSGDVLYIERWTADAFTMPIVNGGTGGGTLYTFPVSVRRSAAFNFDGVDWQLAGVVKLTTVT